MFVEAEVWNVAHTDQGYAVLLRPVGSDTAAPIFIGQLEAQSILIGLGNIPMPRPNTHDLLLEVLAATGNRLIKVEINALNEGIFYSTIFVETTGEIKTIDSRPSDAIALAVRAGCPIYITDDIVEEIGISLTFITETNDQPGSEREQKRISLQSELEEAVKMEKYEEAARLRDELKRLDDSMQ